MFGKKSQSSLLILIGIVSVVMVSWLLISFTQVSFMGRFSKELELSRLSSYLDFFKGYSRTALIFSSHSAVESVAAGGGIPDEDPPRNWICSSLVGPSVAPTVDEVRYYLSEKTLETLNKFVEKGNEAKKDIFDYSIEDFTCVDYDVTQSSVESEDNDKKFNVGAFGSDITVSHENDMVSSSNDIYEEIAQVRFWYMYRKFKEWSEDNKLDVCNECLKFICNCPEKGDCESCPEFKGCVNTQIQKSLEKLEDSFDDYVMCSAELKCCYHDYEACQGIPECNDWDSLKCNRCERGNPEETCSKSMGLEAEDSGNGDPVVMRLASAPDGTDMCEVKKCSYWADTKGAMEALFTCTDSKYLLSTDGERRLTFSVYATMKYKMLNCKEEVVCESEGKYISQPDGSLKYQCSYRCPLSSSCEPCK